MDDSSPPTPELPERKNRLSSNSGIKRNKVSRACDECRKRKVRCDGAQPCARCQKSSTECIFSNVTPKRGPPKQYLEQFESRLKTIDTVLQVLELPFDALKPHELINNWKTKDRIEHQRIQNLNTEPQQQPNHTLQTNLHTDLIQSYFDNIHASIPFISKSILAQQNTSALLLNAIYAVSSKFITKSNNTDPPGWSYYKLALTLIDAYSDIPRLSTIQALLLLAKYHELIYRPGFFWRTKFFIQLAGQMSSDLGLCKEPSSSTQPTFDHEFELRRRTFWALYTYQVLMSTEQGLQLQFPIDECTVEYPHVLSDESSSDSNAVSDFYWLSKVIHTQAAVLEFMRTKYSDTNETFENEQQKFLLLENNLLDIGANLPQLIEESNVHTSFVHLMYHSVTILLYRPYALSEENQYPRYISACLSSASTITQLVDHLLNKGGPDLFYTVVRGNQQIIYCLTVAITIQRALQHMYSDQISELFEKTSSLLQVMTRKSPVSELEDTNFQHQWTERHEFPLVSPSNTSSTRSSPLIPSLKSPNSPSLPTPTIRKRHSRSSLQFPTSDTNYVMQSSSSFVPELISHRMRPTSNRSPYANNRLSAPALGSLYQQSPYFYQMQQQQQQQKQQQTQAQIQTPVLPQQQQQNSPQQPQLSHPQLSHSQLSHPQLSPTQPQQQQRQRMTSYSQPSSPTTSQFGSEYNNIKTGGGGSTMISAFPVTPMRSTSISRKTGLRRSASSTGEFIVPSQQRTNRTSRPYINPRRHTLTNSTPPDLSNVLVSQSPPSSSSSVVIPPSPRNLHAMAVRNNRFSAPVMSNNTQLPYMIPITQQQQNQQQSMMLDPSFPMDPVIPDSPNESMMGLLLTPWGYSQQP
ncbi:hypothetical protein INT48_002999 [Thamnidium elegans]|uniref:Zn(2)-C6 fungal-type domain-containing protein n=1 Tax=Thamnidium elegans TaxID=101142 RepID=A0A8H7VPZ8_9FUNG|nr:hypothetical protein INT48_002999 [Thamnidium elegans]